MSSAVSSRSSQRGFQPSPLLLQSGFSGLRPFLKYLELSLNVRSFLLVLPTGRIQGALRLMAFCRRSRSLRRAASSAGCRHGRRDDVGILALLRRALVKEIAVGTPRFQSRFHRRRRYRKIEKA